MTMTDQKIAKLANKAADVIEERGLCHGHYDNKAGQVCVAGAIRLATTGRVHGHSATQAEKTGAACVAIAKAAEIDHLPDWNDEKLPNGKYRRGKRDAVSMLRRVARKHSGETK